MSRVWIKHQLGRYPQLLARVRGARSWIKDAYPIRVRRRKRLAMRYYAQVQRDINHWAKLRTEEDNFYYSLAPMNRTQLSGLVSIISGESLAVVDSYFTELASDSDLRSHIEAHLMMDQKLRDARVDYGRREGWYTLIRLLKPRLVVETGVHHGVGACVIAAALRRNIEEGFPGRYLGIDIDTEAGKCFVGTYAEVGRVTYRDSVETLQMIDEPIDFFISDSDHSPAYERREYEAVLQKLSPASLIIGDNSHTSSALADFSLATGRNYLFFKEQPMEHWYPGAGIGFSLACVPLGSPSLLSIDCER